MTKFVIVETLTNSAKRKKKRMEENENKQHRKGRKLSLNQIKKGLEVIDRDGWKGKVLRLEGRKVLVQYDFGAVGGYYIKRDHKLYDPLYKLETY